MKKRLRIGLVPTGPDYLKNYIFTSGEGPFFEWKRSLAKQNIELSTVDTFSDINSLDAIIWLESPYRRGFLFGEEYQDLVKYFRGVKILILFECAVICPENYDLEIHKYFDYIFTWNDDLIDNQKYFKYLWPQYLGNKPTKKEKKSRFLTLMNANKIAFHPSELYSERLNAINYFQTNMPDDFDLFGYGWDRPWNLSLPMAIISIVKSTNLNYISHYLRQRKQPTSYRGTMNNKMTTLCQYKFSICYENMSHVSGYMTEKIWDCFKCGVVPIYLGADNITDFVPEDCFIDKRRFSTYESLDLYLKSMSDKTYKQYQAKIFLFMKTKRALRWFDQGWGDSMSDKIVNLLRPVRKRELINTDYFVFTEIFECGKVGEMAIESFAKYHPNQTVHVYGVPRDFEWIIPGCQIVFHDISPESEITNGYEQGHLGTARLWAKLIKERPEKYLIHFDSDIIFRQEALSDIVSKLKTGADLVGPIRNYKNNPNHLDNVRYLPNVCQTLFFGFNRNKVSNYNYQTLTSMCKGSYNPLGHPVIDFFDPVMFDILHNGGKAHFLTAVDYGGYDSSGKRAANKFARENKIIDFGNKLVHFSAAGSGMNFYNNSAKIHGVPDSYRSYALEKYALFCQLFYNEMLPISLKVKDVHLLSRRFKK